MSEILAPRLPFLGHSAKTFTKARQSVSKGMRFDVARARRRKGAISSALRGARTRPTTGTSDFSAPTISEST